MGTENHQAAAYELAGPAWAAGPDRVYAALGRALVAAAPVPLAGARVLDVGAGTGAVSGAARAVGADVVACDLAAGMLRELPPGLPGVQADAGRLPFRTGSFDLAVSGMTLGHFVEPVPVLRELRRVAGALAASAFAAGWTHPAKQVVEDCLAAAGYRTPCWYQNFKTALEPNVDSTEKLAQLATAGGYADVTVHRVEVDTGINDPAAMVAWRLGMAHTAPFVATLGESELADLRSAAAAALAGAPPLVIPILVLAAR